MTETLTLVYVSVGVPGTASGDGIDERGNRCSLSSYDTLERFLERHGHEIRPGSPIVDLRPLADRSDIVTLAWKAPMVDPRIEDDEIDRWQGSDDMGFAPVIAGNYFGVRGAIAAMTTTTGEPGPYDHVSPWRLARYWQDHGATVTAWEPIQRHAPDCKCSNCYIPRV